MAMLVHDRDPELMVHAALVLLVFAVTASKEDADLVWVLANSDWIDLDVPVLKSSLQSRHWRLPHLEIELWNSGNASNPA